jgi:hypothetical protein
VTQIGGVIKVPRALRGQSLAAAWVAGSGAVRDLMRPLGWAGAVGLACLLGAVVIGWGGVRGRDVAAQDLRREIHALHQQAMRMPPPLHVADGAEELHAFHEFFPPRGQISVALDELNRLAAQRQLVLASGDYKFSEQKTLRLSRYELHLPVRGSYVQVYGLVAAALNAMPSLALDEIVIKRESRLAGEVEAQLRFSLYVKQD